MRDLEDETEDDFSSLSLFKALVGEDVCQNSTVAVMAPADSKRLLSDDQQLASVDIPAVTLLGTSQAACVDILEQFFGNPPLNALYPSEIVQGIKPSETTAGRLFGTLLEDAGNTIAYARHHFSGTAMGKDVRRPTTTAAGRSHRRTESGVMKELEESRRHISHLQSCISSAEQRHEERIAQLEETNDALERTQIQLEAKNADLECSSRDLQSELERLQMASFQPASLQTIPSIPAQDLVEQVAQAEAAAGAAEERASSLQSQLEKITTQKTEAIARESKLSIEVADLKKSAATLQRTNGELEKEITGLKKRVEGYSKVTEKKDQVMATAKAEAQAAKGDCEKAKADHDKTKVELTATQAKIPKLEAERQGAMKISEELLKDKKKVESELESSKSQVDTIQKQAKKKVDALQKLLDEKDEQLGSISKAASAWLSAQAQVENLERNLIAQTERADASSRDANLATSAAQATLEKERASWDLQRASMNAAVISSKADRDAVEMRLNMEQKLRELEVDGYTTRIGELDKWAKSRWDAVGSDCVIA